MGVSRGYSLLCDNSASSACDGHLANTSTLTSGRWLLVRVLLSLGLGLARAAAGSAVSDEDASAPLPSDGEDPGTVTIDDGDPGTATPDGGARAPWMEHSSPPLDRVAGFPGARFCCRGHVGCR